ncbi:MAG: A24 family peptidase [Planctomycetota bacterium]|nr:A24 family peptidase [Planctomycetota bacterium]
MLVITAETCLSVIPQIVTGGAALVAAAIDVRLYRIPNLLTFSLCLSGVCYHGISRGLDGFQFSLVGAGAGFLILFWFYVMGVMGAGDVKLLSAIGAWLGAESTFYVFGVAGVATGLYSLAVLASSGRIKTAWSTFYVWMVQVQTMGKHLGQEDRLECLTKQADRRRRLIPFALMVTIGLAVVFVGGYQGLLGVR